MASHFPVSYEASRARFQEDAGRLLSRWPAGGLDSHPLKNFPNLEIDWLWAHSDRKETLVLISAAEHGIEGYVGSAMLKVFMDEFAPRLDPQNTGLLLVHAINPWGMKHRLRVNPNNVDLNRNFTAGGGYDPRINPDYDLLADFLNPSRPVRSPAAEWPGFLLRVVRNMIHPGRARVQAASLLGQHRHAQGIYFGGVQREEETSVLMDLYRKALADYASFVQIDIHSGFGPRYQMTVLIPASEALTSDEAARRFDYPQVQKVDVQEFYAISGDMGEYVHRLRQAEFPSRRAIALGFEFGTFGDTLPALIRSLRITILENQLRHHGAVSHRAGEQVRAEYEELFFPREPRWREKALADSRRAFEGILRAYRLL